VQCEISRRVPNKEADKRPRPWPIGDTALHAWCESFPRNF
jgi:hypothetical protein